jgi:sRNA-binding regulator protein Hfq
MKKILLMIVAVILALNAGAQDNEKYETVYLNNGQVIKGKITAFEPNSHLVIRTDDGRVLRYDMHDVERVQRRARPDNVAFNGDFNGKGPQRGYRGFVDGQATFASGKYGFSRYGVSTTHGYQFRPWLFAGVGYEYYLFKDQMDKKYSTHTIFGDVRLDFMKSFIDPFLDLRVGYNTGKNMGLMVSPSAGIRFALGKNTPLAINVALGYSFQRLSHVFYYDNLYNNKGPYLIINGDGNHNTTMIDMGSQISGGFTVRVGVEF